MLLQCKSKEFLSVDTTDVMFVNVVPVCVCVWRGGGGGTPHDGHLAVRGRLHPKGYHSQT